MQITSHAQEIFGLHYGVGMYDHVVLSPDIVDGTGNGDAK